MSEQIRSVEIIHDLVSLKNWWEVDQLMDNLEHRTELKYNLQSHKARKCDISNNFL